MASRLCTLSSSLFRVLGATCLFYGLVTSKASKGKIIQPAAGEARFFGRPFSIVWDLSASDLAASYELSSISFHIWKERTSNTGNLFATKPYGLEIGAGETLAVTGIWVWSADSQYRRGVLQFGDLQGDDYKVVLNISYVGKSEYVWGPFFKVFDSALSIPTTSKTVIQPKATTKQGQQPPGGRVTSAAVAISASSARSSVFYSTELPITGSDGPPSTAIKTDDKTSLTGSPGQAPTGSATALAAEKTVEKFSAVTMIAVGVGGGIAPALLVIGILRALQNRKYVEVAQEDAKAEAKAETKEEARSMLYGSDKAELPGSHQQHRHELDDGET